MIDLPLTTNSPVVFKAQGMVKVELRNAKRKPVEILEVCPCKLDCEYLEKAFYNLSDEFDEYTNDYTTLFVAKNDSSEVIEFYLVDKDDVETLLPSTIDDDLRGYLFIKWLDVFNDYGNGKYKLKVKSTLFGQETTFETHKFWVLPYNEERADGTIVLETEKTGHVLNGNDYSGDTFKSRVRLQGKFWEQKVSLEREDFERGSRRLDTITQTLTDSYTLEIFLTSNKINDSLLEDQLSSKIYISNYDQYANKQFRKFEVRTDSIEKTEYTDTTKASYIINMSNPIKKIKQYGWN